MAMDANVIKRDFLFYMQRIHPELFDPEDINMVLVNSYVYRINFKKFLTIYNMWDSKLI